MSSMDTGNQLRSQEFVQRSEMQSQSLRQDSANQMVGGVRHDIEAMKQFAMLKAESDAKLQMFEQEMQLNAVKLQHMQALDATDLMQQQVKAARLQNEAAELQLDDQKRMSKAWEKSPINEASVKFIQAMGGGKGLMEAGYKVGPSGIERMSDTEHAAMLKMLKSGTSNQRRLLAKYFRDEVGDDASANEIDAEIRAEEGLKPPPQKPTVTPPPPLDPALKPAMHSIGAVVQNPQMQESVVRTAWAARSDIKMALDSMRTDNKKTPFTEQEAFDYFIEALSSVQHPLHDKAVRFLRAAGGPDIGGGAPGTFPLNQMPR